VSSKHDPADSLADIVDNAERVARYIGGVDRDAFAESGLLRDAVERCIERICEAAFRLGDAAPLLIPDEPWGDLRGMGNRLRHAYDRVDVEVVWNVAAKDLPPLATKARDALRRLGRETG